MKRLIAGGLYLAAPILIGSPQFAAAQMHMAMTTLLVAQLDAKQVVGGSASTATGTGAFLLDAAHKTLAYNLTYEGLSSDGAKSIALHNFGSGKNGETIKVLCGGDAKPCPKSASATISGRFESGDGSAIDNKLLGEFGSERVYVEIVGADGKPEIRGQLSPNQAMVMVSNYTVNLAPAAGTNSKGTGTAIVSETHLPDGKVSVFLCRHRCQHRRRTDQRGDSGRPDTAGAHFLGAGGAAENGASFSAEQEERRLVEWHLRNQQREAGGAVRGAADDQCRR